MNVAKNTATVGLQAMAALLNGGTLTIYSGTMPANPETALSGNTALAAFTFQSTAFGSPTYSGGYEVDTASFTSTTASPTASGTATFARALKSDGSTVVADFTVGTSATDIIVGSTSITTGISLSISSFTLSLPAV